MPNHLEKKTLMRIQALSLLAKFQDALAILLIFAGIAWFAVTWAAVDHWPLPLLAAGWPAPVLFGIGAWLHTADLHQVGREKN